MMGALIVRFTGDAIAVLTEAFAGVVLPVDAAPEAAAPDESRVPELEATIWAGAPGTAALVERTRRDGRAESLAAFVATLPARAPDRPGGFRAVSGAFVRFGAAPIAELTLDEGSVTLRLPVLGAPLVPPPSRDDGGPIDRAWAAAVADARERFARVVARARRLGAVCTVSGEGLDEREIEAVRALAGGGVQRG